MIYPELLGCSTRFDVRLYARQTIRLRQLQNAQATTHLLVAEASWGCLFATDRTSPEVFNQRFIEDGAADMKRVLRQEPR